MRKRLEVIALSALLIGLSLGTGALMRALAPPVSAQQELSSGRDPFAFETITVSTVAIGLTSATYAPAKQPSARAAYCTVEAAAATTAVRYRLDGTAPTAAIGHWQQAGVPGTSNPGVIVLDGTNALTQFRAIRQGAADATLRCSYFR